MSTNGNGTSNGNGHAHTNGNGNGYAVPQPRKDWIVKRKEEAARAPATPTLSQMHFARMG